MRTFLTGLEDGVTRVISRAVWPLIVLVSLALAAVSLRADIVRNLYSAQVPVANQSSQALARASRDALAEVLVKVSGSVEVLEYPAISAALGEARGHVQQYSYSRDEGAQGELAARFAFDGSFVTQLVTRAGAPLWTANRPQVLVWVVVDDDSGRYFVNGETAPDLAEQVLAEFSRRGVPVQWPLFDLADSAVISPQQVWRLDDTALRAASARYGVQNIVAGRLTAVPAGKSVGDWSYLYAGDRIDRSVRAPDLDTFVRDGVSIVAEEMSSRYAVISSGSDESSVSMSVVGVFNYADYAGIVAWLEGLEPIEHANVERIQGDRVELRLHAQADAADLASIIELNDRLVPVPPTVANSQLSYQWH